MTYNFSNWLEFHGLSANILARLTRFFPKYIYIEKSKMLEDCAGSASSAWALCADVLLRRIGILGEFVVDVRDNAARDLVTDPACFSRPFTYDNGPDVLPSVVCSYSGSAPDLLALVHEFAHAVQIAASSGSPMPVLAREVCAFLGERMMLDHAGRTRPSLADALLSAWESDNAIYYGPDAQKLADALAAGDAPYSYRWNYPIARWLADQVWVKADDGFMARLFASGADAMELLKPFFRGKNSMTNNLPPLSQLPQDGPPALQAYRHLGAMALLDLEAWRGKAEESIESYYNFLLAHMREGKAFICLDADQKPMGYAMWEGGTNEAPFTLTQQSAPFGDYLSLQNGLKNYLPAGSRAGARHPNSARVEQAAW